MRAETDMHGEKIGSYFLRLIGLPKTKACKAGLIVVFRSIEGEKERQLVPSRQGERMLFVSWL